MLRRTAIAVLAVCALTAQASPQSDVTKSAVLGELVDVLQEQQREIELQQEQINDLASRLGLAEGRLEEITARLAQPPEGQ